MLPTSVVPPTSGLPRPIYARAPVALAVLLILDAVLFAPFLSGERYFIGNADRFNHYLVALHATGAGSHGWHSAIFGGWNILGSPWFFPLGFESALIGADLGDFLQRALWLAFACFVASGLSAFVCLRATFRSPWLASIGAFLYQTAFASVLRITQNDQTFAAIALAPLLWWAARRAIVDRDRLAALWLAFGCAALMWFSFLQEGAYVALSLAAYLVFLAASQQAWRRGALVALAAGAGLLTGLPRLMLVGRELKLLARLGGQRPFDELFEYQNIRPWEILRFFDDTIFGRNHAEAMLSNLNFSEGFQLFTAQLVPFLLLWLFLSRDGRDAGGLPRAEKWFCAAIVGASGIIIAFKPAYHFVYFAFAGIDFHHTRVIVAALLPLVLLATAALERLHAAAPLPDLRWPRLFALVAIGGFTALALGWLSTAIQPEDFWKIPAGKWHWIDDPDRIIHVRRPAVALVALSGGLILTLTLLLRRRTAGDPGWLRGAAVVVAGLIVGQAFAAASYQLRGPHTQTLVPFENGNSWQPLARDFHPPTTAELDQLHRTLGSDGYRAAVISRDAAAWGLLANSIAEFHGLELIDGYGTGVPQNLAWLPWGSDILRMRQIHFACDEALPWRALALAGIKHLWIVDRRIFTSDPARLDASQFLTNPLPVIPRVFFPARLAAVPTAEGCQAWMLAIPETPRLDAEQLSVVRAPSAPPTGGKAADLKRATLAPNAITLDLTPARHTRFVVVNSRWHPGWTAEAGGAALPVYEVNGFMLGVAVPANATTVRFHFHPLRWALHPVAAN